MEDRIKRAIELKESGHWWNQILYDKAYELIDKPVPIVVPSYNRPDNLLLKTLQQNNIDDTIYHINYMVRESQRKQYEESTKHLSNVHVLSAPDEEINSYGKVCGKIVSLFDDTVLIIHDDITALHYLLPDWSNKSPRFKSEKADFFRVIAMWQLIHQEAVRVNPNTLASTIQLRAWAWQADGSVGWPENSFRFNKSVAFDQLMMINCKLAHECGVNFRHMIGHPDFDFEVQGILAKCDFLSLNNLTYGAPPFSADFTNSDTLVERMNIQADGLIEKHSHLPFIRVTTSQRGYRSVRIDWKKTDRIYWDFDWYPAVVETYGKEPFAEIILENSKKSLW